MIFNHVREYFQKNQNPSLEQIRRIQIEFEPLGNQNKSRVILHLLSDEESIETLSFDIPLDYQEPNIYFIQNLNEQIILSSIENKFKQYSPFSYDTKNNLERIFSAYVNHTLSIYSREEWIRLAIEYNFIDLLDEIDLNKFQRDINNKQIQLMIDEVEKRLQQQLEQRLVGYEI